MKQNAQSLPIDALQEVLDSAANAAQLGTQQFFTPVEIAAALMELLPQERPQIVDLQVGSGNLLAAAANGTTTHLLGVDIDPRARIPRGLGNKAKTNVLYADLTKLYPLLVEGNWQADCFVLNPPFSLRWEASRLAALEESDVAAVAATFRAATQKGTIDSTLATLLIALDRCTRRGEGLLFCNHATALRLLERFTALREHVWQWIVLPNIFPGTANDMQVAVLAFARDHTGGPEAGSVLWNSTVPAVLRARAREICRMTQRNGSSMTSAYYANETTVDRFDSIATEYQCAHAGRKREWNLWLQDGRIQTYLTPFQTISTHIPRDLATELHALRHQFPINLVVQKASRLALQRAVRCPYWRVEPALMEAVENAVQQYNGVRAPFYPLNDVQRLGYLDEEDSIVCKQDFEGFRAGETYSLSTRTIDVLRRTNRLNLIGEPEDIEISGHELLIELKDGAQHLHAFTFDPQNENIRADYVHDLRPLLDHFHIPEVRDIAQMRPGDYRDNVKALTALEVEHAPFRFRNYQKDDLARAAMVDGLILGWDPGLGKTTAAYVWPRLKGAQRVLLVVPGSLHTQTIDEFAVKFGVTLKPLLTHADFENDTELHAALSTGAGQPPCWRITTYQALGYNGSDEWPGKIHEKTGELIEKANVKAMRQAIAADYGLHDFDSNLNYQLGIGEEREYQENTPEHFTIKCEATPCLARLLRNVFDCVVIDEGVRLKSTDSYVSLGVRTLQPQYRLVLTGTPIKNILDDIFWLAHWASGGYDEPSPRWPYENSSEAKERFASEHLLSERNLTKEDDAYARTGTRRRYVKRISTICNIHRLWKLLGPVIIRRRKDDCGEDLVQKTIIPIRVRPGTAQQQIYTRYLQNKPIASKSGEALKGCSNVGVQLQLLRQAALSPDSPQLAEAVLGDIPGPRLSWTDLNPKAAAIFSLVCERLEQGEQVIVLSPFQHFGHTLVQRLLKAGISACHLDGTVAPEKRGVMARDFKQKKYSVLVGGLESMSEGHSFECCATLIIPSLSWSWDKNAQAIDRVHRLTSQKDVTIYVMITENTIDERLYSVFSERTDSSQLALDGRLFEAHTEEVNLAKLLNEAMENFDPSAPTLDEQSMEREWDRSLFARLRNAEQAFRQWVPPVDNTTAEEPVTTSEIQAEAVEIKAATTPADRRAEIRARLEAALAALNEM